MQTEKQREFPGGLVVRIQCFHFCCPGSIPGWGTKIPHAAKHGQKKKIEDRYINFRPSQLQNRQSYQGEKGHYQLIKRSIPQEDVAILKKKQNLFGCIRSWLPSWPMAYGILVPRPGTEPASPALQGRFLTTGPPWTYPTILHLYGPSNRVSKYMWQKLIDLQGEIDESTVTAGDSNTALSKWTDPAGRKSVRTWLNSTTL